MMGSGFRVRMTPQLHLYALLGFLTILAVFGGGSRVDIQSLLLVRPFTVLACAFALIVASPGGLRAIRVPLVLLLLFMAWHLLQLVPLPPSIWQALPGRGLVEEIDGAAGLGELWRPLTMSPSLTLNSFFSLFAPLAALLLFGNTQSRDRVWVLVWLCALATVSAVLAILQSGGSANGPLYFYAITNVGYPNGLFANRNHQSFLLAISIFTVLWLVASGRFRWASGTAGKIIAAVFVLMVLPLILATGSRAGLGLSLLSLVAGLGLVWISPEFAGKVSLGRAVRFPQRYLIAGFAALLALLGAGMVLAARDVALARLIEDGSSSDIRSGALPTLLDMAAQHWFLGGGMGSFDRMFMIAEPDSLLGPRYLNEAHNDFLQIVIEGGVPAVALLICGAIWLAVACVWIIAGRKVLQTAAIPAMWGIACLGMASVFDYPLRVPSLAALFAILVAIVSAVRFDLRSPSRQASAR